MNLENFPMFSGEIAVLDFLKLNHPLISTENDLIKNNQLIYDSVPPKSKVSKFSEC
jgi:hypothetical protein